MDFGDVEKKDVILLGFEVDGRRGVSIFSESTGVADGVVGAELAKGLRGLRGIAKRNASVAMKIGLLATWMENSRVLVMLSVKWSNFFLDQGGVGRRSSGKGDDVVSIECDGDNLNVRHLELMGMLEKLRVLRSTRRAVWKQVGVY